MTTSNQSPVTNAGIGDSFSRYTGVGLVIAPSFYLLFFILFTI